MVYLYAALGVMMMSGIMAVLEMGLSLTGQSLLLKPADPYQQNLTANAVGARDQQMLNLLHNQGDLDAIGRSLQGSALCQQLMCRISLRGVTGCSGGNTVAQDAGSRLSNLGSLSQAGVATAVGDWSTACSLQSGSHRLLIQPDPNPVDSQIPYRLFSCVLSGESTCDFESN